MLRPCETSPARFPGHPFPIASFSHVAAIALDSVSADRYAGRNSSILRAVLIALWAWVARHWVGYRPATVTGGSDATAVRS
ncbi:hypothetical protein [Nocardia sp. NPDC051570]|uniref:hypothetical protein n=1 Tax=Nocardia sp. NPDC051570 TaxID=3364324 RepID=UPI0037B3DC3A